MYQWANSDNVIYNPTILRMSKVDSGAGILMTNSDKVLDFPNDNPTVEERIEYTRYAWMGYDQYFLDPEVDNANVEQASYTYNVNLPDHWFELTEIYGGEADQQSPFADTVMYNAENLTDIYGVYVAANDTFRWSKFHHFPMHRQTVTEVVGELAKSDVMGELNSWTFVDRDWFKGINDMIYVDLFDIR